MLAITHYNRLLEELHPDRVHILVKGRIVASGGPELADQLERDGYEAFTARCVTKRPPTEPIPHRLVRRPLRALIRRQTGRTSRRHRPQAGDALLGGRVGAEQPGHAGVAAALQLAQRVVDVGLRLRGGHLHRRARGERLDALERVGQAVARCRAVRRRHGRPRTRVTG